MNTFYNRQELECLGIKKLGEDVLIGRHVLLYHPEQLEIGDHVRIDDYTIISGKVTLHNYIHISHFCGLYGGEAGIEMMDFSGLSSKVTIYAVSDDYTGATLTNPTIPAEFKKKLIEMKVKIGKHGIVGANSVILPGANVGEGSSIGSMSLCTKAVDSWGIYVGIPAKKVKDRKKDLLEKEIELLKNEEG